MTLLATHIPVMLKEAVEGLAVTPGGRYVDCTLGAGGHSMAILQHSQPGGQLLGIEADPDAARTAAAALAPFKDETLIVIDNFAHLAAVCREHDFIPVNGVLFDLGMSSLQLGPAGRGFSFQFEAPLDMRFNPSQPVSAADIVNTYSETELADLIYEYGEEGKSRQIARAIAQARPLTNTTELAGIIARAAPGYQHIHPATRTFQALRIAVNSELTHLASALEQAVTVLGTGGRLVVISYHSLEDRIVKNFFKKESTACICPPEVLQCICRHTPRLRLVSKGVIIPSAAEIEANPRARSARLRVTERIPAKADTEPARKIGRRLSSKHFDTVSSKN